MLAVHLENGRVEVREVRKPRRPPGFALIRLIYGGICNTDLELQRGYYGFTGTPGHEFVGEVVEADRTDLIGKRVVGEINLACEQCEWCSRSLGRHCPHRTVLGIVKHPGAFREFLTLPERNLRVVPKNVTDRQAVFVEPLAAACEILDQVRIPENAKVAVLGDGKLGLLIAQVLHAHGATVEHFGRHASKLRISQAAGIATRIAKSLPAQAYDWVVDATGSAEGLEHAVRMTRPRGTLILKSTIHGLVPVDTALVIVNELTLVGSRCGRFEPAMKLLRTGKVRVDEMISEVLPLSAAPQAFARAAEKGVLKVLLQSKQIPL
jgi:alcohol dehydrogenase